MKCPNCKRKTLNAFRVFRAIDRPDSALQCPSCNVDVRVLKSPISKILDFIILVLAGPVLVALGFTWGSGYIFWPVAIGYIGLICAYALSLEMSHEKNGFASSKAPK